MALAKFISTLKRNRKHSILQGFLSMNGCVAFIQKSGWPSIWPSGFGILFAYDIQDSDSIF
jgi:hypothetical protein